MATTCTTCYNRSCPEPVTTVTINQTFLHLADGDAIIDVYSGPVTGTSLTLPAEPLAGYVIQVFVNGILQGLTSHYTVSGDTITFLNALDADDVQVKYARLAP